MGWRLSIALMSGFLTLPGCSAWPENGQGGMAERDPLALLSPVLPDENPGAEQALRFDLELVSRHLDVLVLEGAELCFPATVEQARLRQHRIARELQGGLHYDGANDLIIQRRLLGRLERQLDYVKQQAVCTPPLVAGMERPGDMGKRIDELLNSDNQFAFGSSDLSPKYIGRLAEAVRLLRDHPAYKLHITGHADALGDKEYNLEISRERARKVGRYLNILGLEADRIETSAVGSERPYFEGKESHKRQVNRRVTIELVEISGSVPVVKE